MTGNNHTVMKHCCIMTSWQGDAFRMTGSFYGEFTSHNDNQSPRQTFHYGDVIMSTIASQITSLTIVYSTVYYAQIKENIKAPRHWPLCEEFTGDRWIPRTNGQLRGKCFHLMTSSCYYTTTVRTLWAHMAKAAVVLISLSWWLW